MLTGGGRAVAAHYGFDPAIVERMENSARIEVPGTLSARCAGSCPRRS